MKLTCEDCGAKVPPGNIELSRAMAKCDHCGAVFGFADRVANTYGAPERPRVAMPAGLEVVDMGADLTLIRRWWSPKYIFFAVFCLMWNGFLVVWYGLALSSDDAPWMMLVFPLLHVAAGVWLSYFTLAGFMNRTKIRITQGRLHIQHGPLPWPGNRDEDSSRFEQLFCTEEVRRTKNGTTTQYILRAKVRGDGAQKLLTLDDKDQALFLEQRIEAALQITDRPVPGELPRR